MNTSPYELRILELSNGKVPYLLWLQSLEKRDQAIIAGRIQRVRSGLLGDCKSVGEGVFELRINFGPGYRVYFGIQKNKLVLLLCGGDKSTQTKDIITAKKYWSQWEE